MKVLIIFASFFGVVLCAMFGGRYVFNAPASDFPRYLAQAKRELHGLKASDHIAVTKVQSIQTLEEVETIISLTINHHACKIVFWGNYHSSITHAGENTCNAILSHGKRQLGRILGF